MGKTQISADQYIGLLQLGREKGLHGISNDELLDYGFESGFLTDSELSTLKGSNNWKNIEPEIAHKGYILSALKFELFETDHYLFEYDNHADIIDKHHFLKADSYFKLLEHEELVLARESATSARRFSLAAITIALLSLVASIILSRVPITLTDEQYQGIVARKPITISEEQYRGITASEPIKISNEQYQSIINAAPDIEDIKIILNKISSKIDEIIQGPKLKPQTSGIPSPHDSRLAPSSDR